MCEWLVIVAHHILVSCLKHRHQSSKIRYNQIYKAETAERSYGQKKAPRFAMGVAIESMHFCVQVCYKVCIEYWFRKHTFLRAGEQL